MAAFSVIDLLFALGVAATLASIAIPQVRTGLADIRAAGAARHVATLLQHTRVHAITHGCDTAVRFSRDERGFVMQVYEDGNDNGILTTDIESSVDRPVGAPERLTDRFPGVDFGALPNLPGVEGSSPPGTDPIRTGAADGMSFTAGGTATSGSLYLLASGRTQYCVRVHGETGRTRIFKFHPATGTWSTL